MLNPRSTAPTRLMTEPLCPPPEGCREEIIELHLVEDEWTEEVVYGEIDAYDDGGAGDYEDDGDYEEEEEYDEE